VGTWYWELVEMLRKFMLVAASVLIMPGEPAQVASSLFITLFFLFAHTGLQPFATRDLNMMQAVSQGSLMLTLIVGLMMIIGGYKRQEQEAAASGKWASDETDPLFETNQFIFEVIAITVNMTTTITPPLLLMKSLKGSIPNPSDAWRTMTSFVGKKMGKLKAVVRRHVFKKQDDPCESEEVHSAPAVMEQKKLRRPGAIMEPSLLQPAAIGSAAISREMSGSDHGPSESGRSVHSHSKDTDKSDAQTADVPQETGDMPIGDESFRLQMIQGTISSKLASQEDSDQDYPSPTNGHLASNVPFGAQWRIRQLAKRGVDCSLDCSRHHVGPQTTENSDEGTKAKVNVVRSSLPDISSLPDKVLSASSAQNADGRIQPPKSHQAAASQQKVMTDFQGRIDAYY